MNSPPTASLHQLVQDAAKAAIPDESPVPLVEDLPAVSIIMFVRNRVDLVRKAIDSILVQNYPRLQFIVQDCASTDGTVEVLQAYGSQIELVSEPDRGTNDGFWRALKRVKGDIIGTVLSDEEMAPGAIDRAVLEFKNAPEIGAITGDAFVTDLSGSTVALHCGRVFDLLSYLLGDYCPHFAASFFRAQALKDIGFFENRWKDGDLDTVEFELWCRLGVDHRVKYVPHYFARASAHEEQMSQNFGRIADELASRTMIIDRFLFGADNFFGENERLRNEIIRRQHHIVIFHLLCHDQREAAIKLEDRLEQTLGTKKAGHRLTGMAALPSSPNELSPAEQDYRVQLATEMAQLYRARGQIDEALEVWKSAASRRDEMIESMRVQLMLSSPTVTDGVLEEGARSWADSFAVPESASSRRSFFRRSVPLKEARPRQKLTIGYNGTLWNIQTGQSMLLPVIAQHDRNRVKLIGYSHIEQPKSVTDQFDQFHVIGDLDHASVCNLVRSHKVDVFVETNGLSLGNRLAAMSARCAPVQVSYINHLGTCAVPNVDYVLADEITAQTIDGRYFSEKAYALPRCFFSYTYDKMWAPPVSPPPFVKNGYVTFGNFGGPYKLNLQCLALWASALKKVPDSRLLLQNLGMNNAGNAAFIRARLHSLGINPERVIILPGADRESVLKNYDMMDIGLDSWPYCGGNTIAEAFWQGVPVVTLRGSRFVSAYGASLCKAAGLDDLVAHDADAFASIAQRLANDRPRLVALRQSLRQDMVSHGLSDPKGMAMALEDAYFDMVFHAMPSGAPKRMARSRHPAQDDIAAPLGTLCGGEVSTIR